MAAAGFQALVRDNSPFALTTASVAGREQTVFRYGAKTLPEIYRKAAQMPQTPFLVTDTASIGTEELFGRAGAYAELLSAGGIGKDSRVALALKDDTDWIASFIALTSLGATAVLAGGKNPAHQIQAAGCSAAILDQAVPAGLDWIVGPDALAGARTRPVPLLLHQIDPEQEACIAFTSGSSGDPKGAILTHRGVVTGLMNMMLAGAAAARAAPSTVTPMVKPVPPAILLRTPLAHVSAYMQFLLMLMIRGRVIRSSHADICDLIRQHQITSVTGISDDEIRMLLAAGDRLYTLRSIAVVGRSLPARLRHAIRQTLPNLGLGSGYGLTETNGLICAIGNSELDVRPRAVGPVLPTVECRILRGDGLDCAAGESGEIWLRGAMLMRGYCNAPDHQMPNGWFATGDIGYLADDGILNVLDKEDRFLRSGEERISCRDIEDAARELGGIQDIAVLPVADRTGDRLFIVAAPGPEDFSRLRDFLAARFPEQMIRQAAFVAAEKLPRTPSGKIAYSRLLEDAIFR